MPSSSASSFPNLLQLFPESQLAPTQSHNQPQSRRQTKPTYLNCTAKSSFVSSSSQLSSHRCALPLGICVSSSFQSSIGKSSNSSSSSRGAGFLSAERGCSLDLESDTVAPACL